MKIIKKIIYFLIELVEKFEYRHQNFDENNEFKKFIDIIPLSKSGIKVETDYGFVPIEEITLTQPFKRWNLSLENGSYLNTTDHHLLFTENHINKTISELTTDDKILTKSGLSKVKSLTKFKSKATMFDLSVDTHEMSLYTNDILSHNTISASILLLWYCLFNQDKRVLIVANRGKTVIEIIEKLKGIYKNLPFFLKKGVYSWNQMSIGFENGCSIKGEKKTKDPAIGFTIDFLYIDEFAKIDNSMIERYYGTVIPVLSAIENSKLIITSTPNGFNLFYRLLTESELEEGDPRKNRFKSKRIYWWQIKGRRDTKLYPNYKKLNELGIKEEEAIEYIKKNYEYNIYDKIDDNKKLYLIEYLPDNNKTHIDFIRMLNFKTKRKVKKEDENDILDVPLSNLFIITNWQEEETKLIGGEDMFKQEYDLEFAIGSKKVLDSITMEELFKSKQNFRYIPVPELENRLKIPYTNLKFIENLELFDISKAKDYYMCAAVDLAEGLGQDYSVLNLFRLMPKDRAYIKENYHKFENIYDYFKLVQVGIFRSNVLSIKQFAELFYTVMFEVFDPEKQKVVFEYNTYGGEFLSHLRHIFEDDINFESQFTDGIFTRYKHNLNDKMEKIGLKIKKGDTSGKKLLIKDFQTAVKNGNLCILNYHNMLEINYFTKKETPSGDFTFKAENGNDDVVMSLVHISSLFTHLRYKDLIDSYIMTMHEDDREFIESYIIKKDDTTNLNYTTVGTIYNKFYRGGNQIRKFGGRIFQ